MKYTKYTVRVTFETEVLGGSPLDAEVYSNYVAAKAPVPTEAVSDEVATIQNAVELAKAKADALDIKGRTVFRRDADGKPVFVDYMWKGFFKEAWQAMRQVPDSESSRRTGGKSKITDLLFVEPRFVVLHVPDGEKEGTLERPLRADTPLGPRVALAGSELLPIGTWCELTITVLSSTVISRALLEEWLDYGRWLGMGQWRSGGYGRFAADITEQE